MHVGQPQAIERSIEIELGELSRAGADVARSIEPAVGQHPVLQQRDPVIAQLELGQPLDQQRVLDRRAGFPAALRLQLGIAAVDPVRGEFGIGNEIEEIELRHLAPRNHLHTPAGARASGGLPVEGQAGLEEAQRALFRGIAADREPRGLERQCAVQPEGRGQLLARIDIGLGAQLVDHRLVDRQVDPASPAGIVEEEQLGRIFQPVVGQLTAQLEGQPQQVRPVPAEPPNCFVIARCGELLEPADRLTTDPVEVGIEGLPVAPVGQRDQLDRTARQRPGHVAAQLVTGEFMVLEEAVVAHRAAGGSDPIGLLEPETARRIAGVEMNRTIGRQLHPPARRDERVILADGIDLVAELQPVAAGHGDQPVEPFLGTVEPARIGGQIDA